MIFWLVAFAILLLFGFVLLSGAPYLPTMRAQQKVALDLLDLKAGQQFYDLGCGDGRLLLAAARRGWQATGVEINPLLAAIAWLYTLRYRRQIKIIWGNFWNLDLSSADGVFVFLIKHKMPKLDKYLQAAAKKQLRVVSYAFEIPGKKPVKNQNPLFLYTYGPLD